MGPEMGRGETGPAGAHLRSGAPERADGEDDMARTGGWGVWTRTLAAAVVAACAAGVARADDRDDRDRDDRDRGGAVLEFGSMATVQGRLVGVRNPALRNQAAGGLPWVIARGHGVLHADGRLEVDVRGLVLADDRDVPLARRLTNPIPTFRAVVSCVKADGTTETSETPAVPATSDGDAHVEAVVEPPLPTPCVAPIVFVGNGAQHREDVAWFAATGVP
jgi:hypothetical protein